MAELRTHFLHKGSEAHVGGNDIQANDKAAESTQVKKLPEPRLVRLGQMEPDRWLGVAGSLCWGLNPPHIQWPKGVLRCAPGREP